jgi:hypothetical protein
MTRREITERRPMNPSLSPSEPQRNRDTEEDRGSGSLCAFVSQWFIRWSFYFSHAKGRSNVLFSRCNQCTGAYIASDEEVVFAGNRWLAPGLRMRNQNSD